MNVGKTIITTSLSIDGITLPVVKSARDLGVLVSHDLSPSLPPSCTIVAKAHKRSAAIYRAFTCRNTDVLIRAYLTYVRPLVEHDSVIYCFSIAVCCLFEQIYDDDDDDDTLHCKRHNSH